MSWNDLGLLGKLTGSLEFCGRGGRIELDGNGKIVLLRSTTDRNVGGAFGGVPLHPGRRGAHDFGEKSRRSLQNVACLTGLRTAITTP